MGRFQMRCRPAAPPGCWLVLAAFLGGLMGGRALAQVEHVAAEPAKTASVRIVFVGDVMLGRAPGEAIARGEDPFADLAAILKDADLTVGNLECVVATCGEPVPKPVNLRAGPACIPLLQRYFSAVSVANNHSGDYGPEALVEQLALLESAKVPYFGGGRNRKEAHRPLILERNGLRVALLGYNDVIPPSFEAGEDRPGTAWLRPADVIAAIKAAREVDHADLVIPVPHWGLENKPHPEEYQRVLARSMIDAGADAVIGGHAHVTQTVELYKGRPIVYSLGNFVFDWRIPGPPMVSWIVRLTLSKLEPPQMETFVATVDRTDGFPRLSLKPKK